MIKEVLLQKNQNERAGKIAHIWLHEGKECYRIDIDVKPPAWSVYSYFTFRGRSTPDAGRPKREMGIVY
ncbi:MAG: DUF2914 domain-containing protein [Thermodesulfobacteriota bacterium]